MNGTDAQQLAREILDSVEQPGQLKIWLQQRSERASEDADLDKAFVLATEALLGAEPPKPAAWERLLIQLAIHSHETAEQSGLNQCRSVLGTLRDMIEADRVESVEVVTITGALTVALAAQRKLRQQIEGVMKALCEKFDNQVAQIGQHCQGIWRRKGQTSGEQGLFVWDTRNSQWRLEQDFKAYQPDS